MKLAVLSDLHLEISPWDVPERTLREADVIVVAGDIGAHTNGLVWARGAIPGKRIVYVAGNHEFYGAEVHGLIAEMRRVAHELHIDFLEQDEIIIDGERDSVRFLGTTLWTDFQLFGGYSVAAGMRSAERHMLDFDGRIRCAPTSFSPADSIALHRKARDWLAARLNEPFDGKTVVVTHHAPSRRSIAARFESDLMSAAFASNLDDLVAKSHLWVHGHTHNACDFRVGMDPEKGRVICNPRGYRRETYVGARGEKTGWHPRLLIDTEKLAEMPGTERQRLEAARWICNACVERLDLERGSVLSVTAHLGKCDVCSKDSGVMPAGDFL